MAFKFRMEVLLKIKKEEERQAQLKLAELRRREHALALKIQELVKSRSDWTLTYNQEAKEMAPEKNLMLIEKYLIALEDFQRMTEFQLRELSKEIKEAVRVVEAAYKAKKQFEYVKDKQKRIYDEELTRKMAKEIEDINTVRFIRNKFLERGQIHE